MEANLKDYPAATLQVLHAVASEPREKDIDCIYFHSDTIYRHNVMKVPYTTYDCRQDSDTINPHTSRRDFMCLPAHPSNVDGSSELEAPGYVYGRVLGIFHANVMYRGSGALDYRRRRFDFVWARRFTPLSPGNGWSSHRLDRVKLAPITQDGSWDFVDPANILRAAHIIPRFSLGPLHEAKVPLKGSKKGKKAQVGIDAEGEKRGGDERGRPIFSKCAQDEHDWKEYYINRCAPSQHQSPLDT